MAQASLVKEADSLFDWVLFSLLAATGPFIVTIILKAAVVGGYTFTQIITGPEILYSGIVLSLGAHSTIYKAVHIQGISGPFMSPFLKYANTVMVLTGIASIISYFVLRLATLMPANPTAGSGGSELTAFDVFKVSLTGPVEASPLFWICLTVGIWGTISPIFIKVATSLQPTQPGAAQRVYPPPPPAGSA